MSPQVAANATKAADLKVITLNPECYPAYPGEVLNGRYTVLRKLGSGHHSDTWLVEDPAFEAAGDSEPASGFGAKYLAVKVLTADTTQRHSLGQTREQHFLELIRAQTSEKSWGLPILLDHFELTGPQGPHLCFIMHVFGSSISQLRRVARNKALPVYIVKNIVAQLLDCLAQLHSLGIIHTGIKPENILINSVKGDEEVERYLEEYPLDIEGVFEVLETAPPDDSDGEGLPDISQLTLDNAQAGGNEVRTRVVQHPYLRSQPLPLPLAWNCTPKEAELITITLADFGKSQAAGEQPTLSHFAPIALRSPEEILRSYFGPKVDIWAVGCITFELLTGRWLFHPEEGDTWTLDDDHLAKMRELTGDEFTPQMLDFSLDAEQFFDEEGNLLRVPELIPVPLEQAISVYNAVPGDEVDSIADFIRACLRLDPLQRPSARELEDHPWLAKAFSC